MLKKQTPWIKTIRVFKITNDELCDLCKIYGRESLSRVSIISLDFAAIQANKIISNLILSSK